jgi:hypothetical protein
MRKEKLMEILKINNSCHFCINSEDIKPEELSKQNLLDLFNKIYEIDNIQKIKIPTKEEINSIKNDVEREIVSHIVEKIKEFTDNLEQMKKEIDSKFPEYINSEEKKE